jgi:precorrin-2 methylase
MTPPQTGRLYLVGIGPGDPELIICKAVRILTQTSC